MGKGKAWQQSELDRLDAAEKREKVKVGDHIIEPNGSMQRVTSVSKDGATIEAEPIKHA